MIIKSFKTAAVAFCVVLLLITASCSSAQGVRSTGSDASNEKALQLKENVNGINIIIDPRIELLAAVQSVSGYEKKLGLMTNLDFSYSNDMRKAFSRYSSHPAVSLFNSLMGRGFNYDAPPTAMLFLSDPPELARVMDYSDYLKVRTGEGDLDKFAERLRAFSSEAGFVRFYNEHRQFYEKTIEKAAEILKNEDYINDLEGYYRQKQNSYNIILAPMFSGGYGPKIKSRNGYDIYDILGPSGVDGGIPTFGKKEDFQYLAWHEFSHSFVNSLSDEHISEIDLYNKLYTPLEKVMKKQAYSSWKTCTDEHIVRAVTARLTLQHYGQEAYETAIENERKNGFFYIGELADRLAEFESNRDKYRDFSEFYPELIKVFKDLSEKDLGKDYYKLIFSGPVNETLTMGLPITVVTPTAEADSAAQKKIQDYAIKMGDFIHDKCDVQVEVITDKDALKKDLKDRNIIVYGTIEGNLWLAKYSGNFPFSIRGDGITAGKEYKGDSLRFITALPNPVNVENGMTIYTAQNAKDIPGINSVFHGPTDYLVLDGSKELKSGNYKKSDGKWSFE